MRIKEIMTKNLIKADSGTTIQQLDEIIRKHNIHHIPVVDEDDHLVGIVSDRDVSKHISPYIGAENERQEDRDTLNLLATSIMSNSPVTITEDSRIDTASILLLEHNFSCLPVMDDDENTLVGIVTWKDILNYYVYSASVA